MGNSDRLFYIGAFGIATVLCVLFALKFIKNLLFGPKDKTKVCPSCKNRINWNAKKCPYCLSKQSSFDIGDLITTLILLGALIFGFGNALLSMLKS